MLSEKVNVATPFIEMSVKETFKAGTFTFTDPLLFENALLLLEIIMGLLLPLSLLRLD
jgi:hypothetical protein